MLGRKRRKKLRNCERNRKRWLKGGECSTVAVPKRRSEEEEEKALKSSMHHNFNNKGVEGAAVTNWYIK